MSCWRNYKCNALKKVEEKRLKEAVAELGVVLNTNIKRVVSDHFLDKATDVDGVLTTTSGKVLSLGLIWNHNDKAKEGVEIVGDFWNTGLNSATFMDQLSQTYQKKMVLDQLQLMGYSIDYVETTAEGAVEIEAYMW